MKLGHTAALALAGWYLMVPPRVSDWPVLVYDTSAPLSKWHQGGSFDTAKVQRGYEEDCRTSASNCSKNV
jgi:hypothetical protein